MDGLHPTAAGFEQAADDYRRARPGYPRALVASCCARLGVEPGRRVLDLGAGTGVLTRDLLARGAEVVAVEPVPGMARVLAADLPAAGLVAARAEALPLASGSLDAATVAQAFHWFDAPAALAELHRTLRPGRWLAVLFNIRDLTDPVQAEVDDALVDLRGDTPSWATRDWDRALRSAAGFHAPEMHVERHVHRLDAAGFRARIASISFVAQLPEGPRTALLDELAAVFDRHAADGRVAMGYRAELTLLRRRAGRPAAGVVPL